MNPHHACTVVLTARRPFAASSRTAVSLLAALALFPCASAARAQATPEPKPENAAPTTPNGEIVQLETFVISGTVAPKRPMETPVSITTIDVQAIKINMPTGAPDLIKMVPGFYVETAGGETRSNVRTRGLPSSGGFVYAGLQEDGLPMMTENGNRNTVADAFTRATAFVVRAEAVRGGTAGVFQNNAPGGIINFISREGGAVFQGEATVQMTDYQQLKGEVWAGGPLGRDTTYAFYAGYRRDHGLKDCDFVANRGGSFLGNVKHSFADGRGSLKATMKLMDEYNTFFVPVPFKGTRDPKAIPGGFDLRSGTFHSAAIGNVLNAYTATPDGDINLPATDGQHVPLTAVTVDLDLKVAADWKLKAVARYTDTKPTSDTQISTSVATPLQTLANSIASAAGGQFASALSGGNYRYRLTLPSEGGQIVADPTTLNGNGLGMTQLMSTARLRFENLQSDLRVLRTIDGGGIAAGLYLSRLESRQYAWGHTLLTEIKDNPRPLDFEFLHATTGASLGYGTAYGLRQLSAAGSYRRNTSTLKNVAPYLNLEKTLGNWTLDAGVRRETKESAMNVQLPTLNNLNAAGQNNPALRNAAFQGGNRIHRDYSVSGTVWTTGVNYKLSDHSAAYGRYVNAYRLPVESDMEAATRTGSFNPGPTERIRQIEAGIKYSSRKLSVFATAVQSELENNAFAGVFAQPDGSVVSQVYYRSSKALGLELEAFYTPIKPLTFHLVSTVQKVEYTSDVFISGTNSLGRTIALNLKGNTPVRVPEVFFNASADYKFPAMRLGRLALNAGYEYMGARPADEGNLATLKAYGQVNLGFSLASGRVTWRAQVKNAFDTVGFTEGDPRVSQLIADPTAAYANFRTIFPRSFVGSVTYSF